MIEAQDIHKYYTNGKERIHVLKGVSLRVPQGKIAAILGPSGAGKSTLLHILGGLDKPSTGKVFFEGRLLTSVSDAALADLRNSTIGFVFQFYHLLPEFTTLENVMMPAIIGRKLPIARCQAKIKAIELLEEVGLHKRLAHYPSQLSGGEKQRVALARALMNEPKLLLCDEPTGNLDSENGRQICLLLKKLNKEKAMTIVLITHNLEVASLASCVYTIKDGLLGEKV